MSPTNSVPWLHALKFAAEKHRNQRRKDADASPYINHPIAVAAVLATEAGVTDEATLLAALLHDTVEDTETTVQELQQLFGPVVAALVGEMSDDKSLPKEARKGLVCNPVTRSSRTPPPPTIENDLCNLRGR